MVNGGLVVITIFCCHFCWTGGRTDSGSTNGQTTNIRKDKQTDKHKNGRMDGWTGRRTDGGLTYILTD